MKHNANKNNLFLDHETLFRNSTDSLFAKSLKSRNQQQMVIHDEYNTVDQVRSST